MSVKKKKSRKFITIGAALLLLLAALLPVAGFGSVAYAEEGDVIEGYAWQKIGDVSGRQDGKTVFESIGPNKFLIGDVSGEYEAIIYDTGSQSSTSLGYKTIGAHVVADGDFFFLEFNSDEDAVTGIRRHSGGTAGPLMDTGIDNSFIMFTTGWGEDVYAFYDGVSRYNASGGTFEAMEIGGDLSPDVYFWDGLCTEDYLYLGGITNDWEKPVLYRFDRNTDAWADFSPPDTMTELDYDWPQQLRAVGDGDLLVSIRGSIYRCNNGSWTLEEGFVGKEAPNANSYSRGTYTGSTGLPEGVVFLSWVWLEPKNIYAACIYDASESEWKILDSVPDYPGQESGADPYPVFNACTGTDGSVYFYLEKEWQSHAIYQLVREAAGDTAPPEITTSAQEAAVDDVSYSFWVKAEDDVDGIVTPIVRLGGEEGTLLTGSAQGDGSYGYTATLSEGANTIYMEASDESSNKATHTVTVTYEPSGGDTEPPVITTEGIANETVTEREYTFTARAADDVDGEVAVTVKLNGTEVTGTEGSYAVTLAQGANTVTIEATDSSHNKAEKSYTILYEALPGGVLVKVGAVSGRPGQEVTVPVEIENVADLAGGQFTLIYDPAVAIATQVEAGDFLAGFHFESNLSVAGEVYAAFAEGEGTDGSGELVRVTFQIREDPQGESAPVRISGLLLNDEAGQGIPAEGENGEITVAGSGILYGDVSGDGDVTAGDATLVLQSVVKLITLTPEQITLGDVNGDGAVTAADATLILRYVVELIDTFPAER